MFKSASELVESISETILQTPEVNTAILAGNQVVDHQGEYSKSYGVYPEISWQMGCQILENIRTVMPDTKIFVVVNDWRNLRSLQDGPTIRRQHWNDSRFDLNTASNAWVAPYLLSSQKEHHAGRVSEQALHNQFEHFMRSKLRAAQVRDTLKDIGHSRDNQCEQNGCSLDKCATEYVMILRNLNKQKIHRLIAFLPSGCHNNIEVGAQLFSEETALFASDSSSRTSTFNVYLNSASPQNEQELFEIKTPKQVTIYR